MPECSEIIRCEKLKERLSDDSAHLFSPHPHRSFFPLMAPETEQQRRRKMLVEMEHQRKEKGRRKKRSRI
ncbi:hypothetical protein L5515_017284 [Caenorhabditis briggsae]|uniref:Uncharacterized protein n=1 Tax=Caenorhabditis briggsae TaxID=6238 RepID=A0AAE9JRC9_CAEBR|nr:hypothetical protein L5515_017284 [Caenorhabditis briggsae]